MKIDFNRVPKQFCDNITIGFNAETFLMALASGEGAIVYALSPEHAKRLMQYLEHDIAEYEKQFGEIKASWSPGIPSPFQSTDFPAKN